MVCIDDGKVCYHDTYLKCPKCKIRTSYGEVVTINDDYCYVYECPASRGCGNYYALCVNCNPKEDGPVSLMRLIMHHNPMGVEKNGLNYRINEVEDGNSMVDYIMPTHRFSQSIFGPLTGPDGGFPVLWKCDTCKEEYEVNDK